MNTLIEAGRFAHPARNVRAFGVEPGMRIADFGAGSGVYTLLLAEALYGSGHVVAVDVNRELLHRIKNEAARRGHGNVEIIWGDLESPLGSKLQDNMFDIVLMSNILFQLNEMERVLSEAHRVLKPKRRLVLIEWKDSFGGMGPHPNDVVERERAAQAARDAGFEFMRDFHAGAHHYGLMFRKIV